MKIEKQNHQNTEKTIYPAASGIMTTYLILVLIVN